MGLVAAVPPRQSLKSYRPIMESGRAAYENVPAVSGVAHSLASKTSSVLSFNMEDVDNE